MKKVFLLLLLVSFIKITAQNDKLNNYKYVVVAKKFDFLKKPDQYQTSSLTKFLLKKNGFTVFLSDENLPLDLSQNRCLALFASVQNESSMLTIKNRIVLKDCKGNVVFTSELGRSKLKEYKKAYLDAIRKAHNSMIDIEYMYKPLHTSSVKEKMQNIKDDISSKEKGLINNNEEDVIDKSKNTDNKLDILYAQSKSNGFQLVNTKPEVVFIILKTGVENVYVIKGKNGILYKDTGNWVAEYYEDNSIVKKNYQIKF